MQGDLSMQGELQAPRFAIDVVLGAARLCGAF